MSNRIKDGGPAFPQDSDQYGPQGMSLRDWIAGQCMAAAFGGDNSVRLDRRKDETIEDAMRRYWSGVAEAAVIAADAMIAALEGKP
jgi:hypothetical protein